MKLILQGFIHTQQVLPGIKAAIEQLIREEILYYEWAMRVIHLNQGLGTAAEYGTVLFPFEYKKDEIFCEYPPKIGHRIVVKQLPDRARVLTSLIEIGFGRDDTYFPLLGTEESPRKGLHGLLKGDSRYLHDFSAIAEGLKKVLFDQNRQISTVVHR